MKKILIVDDSPMIRVIIKGIVSKVGCTAIDASNADESVQKYKAERPDVVFMDIIMGGKSGVEALKEILEYDSNAIVVMCSSISGQDSIIEETVRLGAAGFITKPFSQKQILDVIEKYS